MKRMVREGANPAAEPELRRQSQAMALALLDRSIKFGHHRLAIQRLGAAVELEASVNADRWAYFERVARQTVDAALRTRFEHIKQIAGRPAWKNDQVRKACQEPL